MFGKEKNKNEEEEDVVDDEYDEDDDDNDDDALDIRLLGKRRILGMMMLIRKVR